jgi:hypothetical protein
MAEPLNKALKQGVDYLVASSPPSAFSQPMMTDEDPIARGLLDEMGNPTSKGALFVDLQEAGMIDPDGKLSRKGAVYAMPYEQTLNPENREVFKERTTDGVDAQSSTWGEMVGGVGEMLWDAGAGAARHVGLMAQAFNPFDSEKHETETTLKRALSATSIIDGAIQATQQLVGMGEVGAGLVGEQLGKMIDMDKEAENTLWSARQDLARTRFQQSQAKVGETLDNLAGVEMGITNAETAKRDLPPAEYAAIAKQGNAFGQFLDPSVLIPAGAAAKAGKVGIITRAGIQADATLAKVAGMEAKLAEKGVQLAASNRAATVAANAAELSGRMADELATRFDSTGDQVFAQRSRMAREVADRTARESAAHGENVARLAAESEQLAATRQSLATRIPEAVAASTQAAIQTGRAAKSIPLTAIGGMGEKVGKFLIDTNTALSKHAAAHGYEGAMNILKYGVAPVAGLSIGGLPGAAGVLGVLASGPVINATSKFTRIVGQELMKARGQIPFWQRVANYSELSAPHRFMSHLLDTATLGGAVPGAIRRTARGTVAAYPIDLMFEYLSDGGDPNADTFKRAAAQALVIGGSSAMLGGMFQGTKARHRELAFGDELNFRQNLTDPGQRDAFNRMNPGVRRSIATFSASNPQLEIRFTDQGGGSYADGVATINPLANNPLKPLIAHEVMHHVVIRNQNEAGVIALMLGDGETGGILRDNDGTLDPNFKQFHDAYNARMIAEGRKPVDVSQAALEYYIDASADHVASIAESGELGAIAGKSQAGRAISKIVEGTVPKLPIIRDLHFKLGGLLDGEGRMVMGSGLLADGIRESPQVRAMTRQMLRNSSGRSQGRFHPMGDGKGRNDEGGAKLAVSEDTPAVLDKIGVTVFEREAGPDGRQRNKKGKDGKPVLLSREKDKARTEAGREVAEILTGKNSNALDPAVVHIDESGGIVGNHFSDDVIADIERKGIYNPDQIRMMRNINDAIRPAVKTDSMGNPMTGEDGKPVREFAGHRFSVLYHAALKTIGKRKKYESLAPTIRDVVPVSWLVAKNGPISYGLLNVSKLFNNIETRLTSKLGKRLYDGNREKLFNDVKNVMELHRADKKTDAYFEKEYGAAQADEYKKFVNTLFGVMSPSMKDVNPLFQTEKIGYEDNVYRTFRIDRTSSATKMTGDTHLPLPFVYTHAKMNLMPNGLPTLGPDGKPIVKANYFPDGTVEKEQ